MAVPGRDETLLRPKEPLDRQSDLSGEVRHHLLAWRRPSTAGPSTTTLPADLMNRGATRLQALGMLYAFTFFMADFFPELLFDRQDLFESPIIWAPGLISIAVALSVVVVLRTVRLQSQVVIATALIFEIVSSYGIAAAEFLQPLELTLRSPWIGLSWVAVWTYAFNVVVPTPPRYAVVAALAAVSSVPAMVALSLAVFPFAAAPDGLTIFFRFGFPYILVVILSYGGAHVVYSLGKEVKRARELGSYRLVVRLGEGGMGEVWKARHRLLARPAAIKHAHQPPEPPSARTELPIPPDLDELVLSCLAKDRDCRPTSPRDLLERLEIVMLRQQPWTEARAREWWTMHLPPSAE